MNSPVVMFSNDNFPVLMAFKLRFLFFIFIVCCCRPRASAGGPPQLRYPGGASRPKAACGASVSQRCMMLAQARPDRAAPILLSYCLPFVCRLSGEALPPLLPPELLSPRIASSSAFVYPYPIESSSSSS